MGGSRGNMTHTEFIFKIEGYYGKYPRKLLRDSVYTYIVREYPEKQLGLLFELVKKNYTSQYRSQPDIAIFEEIKKNYNTKEVDRYEFANGSVKYFGERLGGGNKKKLIENKPKEIEVKE